MDTLTRSLTELKNRVDTLPDTLIDEIVDRVTLDVERLTLRFDALNQRVTGHGRRIQRLNEEVAQRVTAPAPAIPPETTTRPSFSLQRITRWGDDVAAVFVNDRAQEYAVDVGEPVNGWIVTDIQPGNGAVTLNRGSQSVRLFVGE